MVRTVKSVSLVSRETDGCPCDHPQGVSNRTRLKTDANRKRWARKLLQDGDTIGLRVVYELAIREVKREFSVVSCQLIPMEPGVAVQVLKWLLNTQTGHEAVSGGE